MLEEKKKNVRNDQAVPAEKRFKKRGGVPGYETALGGSGGRRG